MSLQWYATHAGIWRLQNQQLVISVPIGAAAFSPDSSKVAIARYSQIAVYDLRTTQLLWRADGFSAYRLQFSADSTRLMSVNPDLGEARVYDANTGQLLWQSNVPFDSVDDVLLSPDGALVAIRALDVGTRERVQVYRVNDGSFVYRAPYAPCDAFAFSPNSRYLVFSVRRATVVCHDLQQGELLWEENYQAPLELSSESFSPDSQFVLLAQSNTPVVVGVRAGMPAVFADSGHPFSLRSAHYSDDGARVVLLYEDGTVALNRVPVRGDTNRDECVNNTDLLTVLFNFGTSSPDADLNRDGVVNNADLLIVLLNFGNGC
ncbi:MAG: hypothetical protein RMK45_09065 [Armatimonadota bacterium]|nr:hypothetical protein [Armatimonadota bacterium]